ncbi:MAG TPA: hypothetical protein VJZ00_20420 [Thermoanaerobaculia bacterium]|nr:hypothetical protein [Thermoanaerobaculia bacterium]
MFESIPADTAPQRLRRAATPPLIAYILAQVFFSILPIVGKIESGFFVIVELVLLAGAIAGAIRIIRTLRAMRIRGIALVWLALALIVEYLCARLFAGIAFRF